MSSTTRGSALLEQLESRVLVMDGATGTWLQQRRLTAADFGGPELEGCNEHLVVSRPDVVTALHRAYLDAGADVVLTNTFGATSVVLAEYGLEDRAEELNLLAARLAREAADVASAEGRTRFVAGSMGPTTRTLSLVGGATFEQLRDAYAEQARGLIEGGVDLLLLETCQDTLNVKAGILGVRAARADAGVDVPLAISCTIEQTGTMLAGQDVEAFWTSVAHADPLFVGINCSTGPDFMLDHLRTLSEVATTRVSCHPNAGLPDEDGAYHESPAAIAHTLRSYAERGWLNLVGGCCGTTEEHVRRLVDALAGIAPRRPAGRVASTFAGLEAVTVEPENRPLLIGERTNVIGSRRFKRLVSEEDWEAAAEVGRRQVRGGAQLLDVCLADPDRDERRDLLEVLGRLVRRVRVPLVIDSTDGDVIEAALKTCQGKAIVNSINLEDGLDRFECIAPLLRAYGAAVVVGCIDEDPVRGMAVTRERKLEIALRSHALLTREHGLPETDILIDPLVFPVGTGDAQHARSAIETLEGVRAIKRELPRCPIVLGISNVSFGLPAAAREVVNSVFLHELTRAGLDMAIVNTERIERYASLSEEDRRLAEDLLWHRVDDGIGPLVARFRDRERRREEDVFAGLTLDERISRHVVEGIVEGVVEALELARRERRALDLVNGPLMAGMDEVGRLFDANELIVAEVLQSAEVMKTAVGHLEQFMERSERRDRGTVLLATVKGDVHDIGKNLVEIILSNNGYRVVNLGIKVLPQALLKAAGEHRPNAIGLSGLLVKSTREMLVTVREFESAGLDVPVLVGGAALSRRFADGRIAPAYSGPVVYCRDATDGLSAMNRLADPDSRSALLGELARARDAAVQALERATAAPRPAGPSPGRSPAVRRDVAVLRPPDLRRHVQVGIDLHEVLPFLNEQALLGRHLGLRGPVARLLADGDVKALDLRRRVEDVRERALGQGLLEPRVVWQFHAAVADGDAIVLLDRPAGRPVARWAFPRQSAGDRLCLADFVLSEDGAAPDFVATFVTTCGIGLRPAVEARMGAGEYFAAHVLQALALEGAEATAEWLHARLRRGWGCPDPEGTAPRDLFKARYRGLRVSFGYPACPRLEDQRPLFDLLRPDEIGVTLTDGCMMDPEASVSALVFHHPDARYFDAASEEARQDRTEASGGLEPPQPGS